MSAEEMPPEESAEEVKGVPEEEPAAESLAEAEPEVQEDLAAEMEEVLEAADAPTGAWPAKDTTDNDRLLAARAYASQVVIPLIGPAVMLLAADDLRVALATTHLPLGDVPAALTTDGIASVIRILDNDLREKFGIDHPEIIVCGLNPHAGEGGHLGREDDEIIRPAVERCVADGIRARGPVPADTAFTPAAGDRDVVLAMYHDQGLPVVKYAGFGQVVNVTLGLPLIRTSVDHGTALDIAGTGKADPGSMLAAIALADELARV